VRWRWNATTALALPRFSGGRKVAPQLQRMRSQDLLAAVFPDQVACAENLSGPREVPAHPLVKQTLADCLDDAMDARGWLRVLQRMESGEIAVLARDLPAPSPLAAEALTARPYAFLDDAPLEERRTQAVRERRYGELDAADELGRLDAGAIEAVRREAWPEARSVDEMHEALSGLGAVTDDEAAREPGWSAWLKALAEDGRASAGHGVWVAAERLALARVVYPQAVVRPPIELPRLRGVEPPATREDALCDWLRARLSGLGPVTVDGLAASLALAVDEVRAALLALQAEGSVLQGHFTPGTAHEEWCERHLLARIHRYTLARLRREIEPVEPRDFMRFLFEWQHLAGDERMRGDAALPAVLAQLEGYEAPAAAWEAELLPARIGDYSPFWLNDLCTSGRLQWTRLRPPASPVVGGRASLRATPILLLPRRGAALWSRLAPAPVDDAQLGHRARRVVEVLSTHGASFFHEIVEGSRLLPVEAEEALSELVAQGRLHCDSYAGLRALLVPPSKRAASSAGGRRRRVPLFGIEDAGRWTLVRPPAAEGQDARAAAEALEQVARVLLRRYGVIAWRLLEREAAWLPPWRELVRVYRRLEARGEIRGGRFIAGLVGEQFALPEAIARMRQVRRGEPEGRWIALAAADPANLLGSVVPGDKAPRVAGSRVLYLDGLPMATSLGSEVTWLIEPTPTQRRDGLRVLIGTPPLQALEAVTEVTA
jgi:ATP-dependent Lhr-like helicase